MPQFKLETHDNRTTFAPGETIQGLAGWELDEAPESVEVHLFWHTTGKGDRDVGTADQTTFPEAPAVDAQIFKFTAPNGPYSYDGKLIAIHWALELIVEPGHHVERLDLTIAPDGEALQPATGAYAPSEPASNARQLKDMFKQ